VWAAEQRFDPGSEDLVAACAFNACPRPFIGRPMKAGKEEILAFWQRSADTWIWITPR